MKIAKTYSHLNGLEFLEARHPKLLNEIEQVIAAVDAAACRTKVSKEKRTKEKVLHSPKAMNLAFEENFRVHGWHSVRETYWVSEDADTNRKTMDLPAKQQRKAINEAGFTAFPSSNQTDFVKERVAVEVQFGKYSFIAYDLFVKHMAFYVSGRIDVGVEIVPMKCLQSEMSSGPGYFESELYNLVREGRGVPPVPLVMIGIAP